MAHTPRDSTPGRARAAAAAFLLCAAAALAPHAPGAGPAPQEAKARAGKSVPAAAAPQAPLLKRTTTRKEVRRLGHGGKLTLYGAPEGSITVEAWPKGEIEITADVELSAPTEEELARLAAVNNFVLDDDLNHVRLTTVGTHDRLHMKRTARDFPKHLLAMPWKVDYRVRVPAYTDLEVYAGRGALSITNVEGALRLNAGDSDASLVLAGGDVEATFKGGNVSVRVPSRNWRGRGLNLRLASGALDVELPAGFHGDVDAEVLRAGRVENTHAGLAPRERTRPSEKSLHGRAGGGGAKLSFTVGDGTLRIRQETRRSN